MMPYGTKPLPEPKLSDDQRGHATGNAQDIYSWYETEND